MFFVSGTYMKTWWEEWNCYRRFTICHKWVQKLKNWINFTSCRLKQNDFPAQTHHSLSKLFILILQVSSILLWHVPLTLDPQIAKNLQEARMAAQQFGSGHKEDEIKTASPEIASERGLSENSGRKKRHPLWPAIQPPLSSLCLSHHAHLIAELHSAVCLQYQNYNHCSQEWTFPANFFNLCSH